MLARAERRGTTVSALAEKTPLFWAVATSIEGGEEWVGGSTMDRVE